MTIWVSQKSVVTLLLAATVLLPFIRVSGQFPDVRPEFLLIVFAWGLLLLSRMQKMRTIDFPRLSAYFWFALVAASIQTSTLYAVLVKNAPLSLRDFWEVAKVGLYFAIFVYGVSVRLTQADIYRVYVTAVLFFLLSSIVGYLQYVNFLGINSVITPYYAPAQMRGLEELGRIVGTTPNPNDFGALMVVGASLALAGGLTLTRIRTRLLAWLAFLVFVGAIALTQSRTALVDLGVALFVVVSLYLVEKKVRVNQKVSRLWLLSILLVLILVVTVTLLPERMLKRFAELASFSEASSFRARIVLMWKPNISLWLESPILGWGPSKELMDPTVDNEWLLILRRYGLVGLGVFGGFFLNFFRFLERVRRKVVDMNLVALVLGAQGALAGLMVHMLTAVVYHHMQLMSLLMVLLSVPYAAINSGPRDKGQVYHETGRMLER